ncbi:hypothetical protein JHK87_027126 [Glycine soja]|nr:hypothetical protein JHK87_027126 [Glycine soja]
MSDKKGSTSNHGLNLNIPPPRVANQIPDSPTRLPIAPPTSPTSSCVSSELSLDDNRSSSSNNNNNRGCTRSPKDISMVLVGCSRCLMYMMVNEGEPKCPKCKSTTLIHFLITTTTSHKEGTQCYATLLRFLHFVPNELSQDDNSSSSSYNNNNRGCTRSPEDISMVLVSGGVNIDDNCGFAEDGSRCIGGDRGSSVSAYGYGGGGSGADDNVGGG